MITTNILKNMIERAAVISYTEFDPDEGNIVVELPKTQSDAILQLALIGTGLPTDIGLAKEVGFERAVDALRGSGNAAAANYLIENKRELLK